MGKSLNKFLKNKNTVTILGVLICVAILFIGYNMRINQKTALVTVYYANQTIQPKTLITEDMVSRTQVPGSFILGSYYKNYDDIVGKYSNYNTMISEGSLFYYDLLIEEENLPDAVLYDLNEGEKLVSMPVNMTTTYGNSIMPGNKVDIYVKLLDSNKIVYGEYFTNVEVLGVKDSNGRNVFENSGETRTPAYVYFSLPEAKYLLFKGMDYLKSHNDNAEIEIVLVPNTKKYETTDPTATEVASNYLYDFVLKGIKQIDSQKALYDALINEIDQSTSNKSSTNTTNNVIESQTNN